MTTGERAGRLPALQEEGEEVSGMAKQSQGRGKDIIGKTSEIKKGDRVGTKKPVGRPTNKAGRRDREK